ncbi:MAG: DUF721 domain-containing protein [Flavobacteriales bacterium]
MSDTKPLKGVFEMMIERYKMKNHFKVEQIKSVWEEVVGTYIANYTEKLVVKDYVLHVKIKSPELRNELQYAKSKLIQNLNNQIGEYYIKDIELFR